jgi:hypothetical protein
MFGTLLSLPAEFIQDAEPPAEHFLERLRGMEMLATSPLVYAEVAAKPPMVLMEASHVYIRRGGAITPLAPLFAGPYKVVARQAKFFKLEIGAGLEMMTVDRLEPHLGLAPVVLVAPQVRGRPPAAELGYRL